MDQGRSSALGARARRRLVWLAATAGGLLVVGGVIHHVTSAGGSSQQQQRLRYGEMDLQIAYGSTPKQVLRQLGSPTTRQADCWIYRGRVGSIRGRYSGPYIDAMKFCFSAGAAGNKVVTQIFNHLPARTIVNKDPVTHVTTKEHFPARWLHAIIIQKVPDSYAQQHS
jgi:hypothetical protein